MFGMASVWGAMEDLSVRDISIFVGALYVGGLVLQYPIGWLSDRMDRRLLITGLSGIATVVMLVAGLFDLPFMAYLVVALLLGGITNPVYALLIAYTNDFLSKDDMAAASAGMIFLNGFGAIFGPIVTGWIMAQVGSGGFFLFIAALYALLTGYAIWRMSRRASPAGSGPSAFIVPTASPVAATAVIEKDR
jgi:MFS family permease